MIDLDEEIRAVYDQLPEDVKTSVDAARTRFEEIEDELAKYNVPTGYSHSELVDFVLVVRPRLTSEERSKIRTLAEESNNVFLAMARPLLNPKQGTLSDAAFRAIVQYMERIVERSRAAKVNLLFASREDLARFLDL